jgi:uncharacterized protein (TIGR01777 family)
MKVLVTGATGFVGQVIVRQLLEAGDQVVVLTRNVAKAALTLGSKCQYVQWADTNVPPLAEVFNGVEGVINLMGENIADKKWDEEQKKKIHDSRIIGTANLIETISHLTVKPKVLVSTSAIGIYGNRGSEELSEASQLGNDFLAGVCKDWENEANKAKALGLRVVIIRVGMVIGKDGGALKKMLPVFKLGAGGPLGSGNQYMSWIHVDDLAAMYIQGIKNSALQGPLNGTSPYPTTNTEFTKCLGKTLKRPAFMRAPEFALKFAFGEMSEMLLGGQKVLPVKFKEKHYRYRYPTLEMALKETI